MTIICGKMTPTMSRSITESIAGRLRLKQAAEIDRLALTKANAEAAIEHALTEEALVRERAEKFCAIIRGCDSRWRNGGFIARRQEEKQHAKIGSYNDHFSEGFITPSEHWLMQLVRDRRPVNNESGLRTVPFGLTKEFVEDLRFGIGWQIGVPTERSTQHPGAIIVTDPSQNSNMPLRIWRYAQEVNSGEEERQLAYDVDIKIGEVQSYSDGSPDDSNISLAKQAGAHAIGLINQAIELLA